MNVLTVKLFYTLPEAISTSTPTVVIDRNVTKQ